MASANAKATRRAVARQRLDAEVSTLAWLLAIEMPGPGRPVQDPELAAIIDMERQADLLAGITAAVRAAGEQHIETTQKVAEIVMEAVSGRESLSGEEKAELAQIVAEAMEVAGRTTDADATPTVEPAVAVDAGESRADIQAHEQGTNTYLPPDGEPGVTLSSVIVTPIDLNELTRKELNVFAEARGIDDAAKLPNKDAVIAAIEALA
ncbi:MAG: hypothetical protein WBA46_04595 [Thermomicrobiales bacterium]